MDHGVRRLRAAVDPGLSAVLRDLAPLRYAAGGSAAGDYPGLVRAASAVRRVGPWLLVVQDDVNVLALHPAQGGSALGQPILLPRGDGGRRSFGDSLGNKHGKLDLEACACLPDGRLVAFGSGSSSARERLAVLVPGGEARLQDGSELYADLRREVSFAGSELNLEGALVSGAELVLFQRGNGAPSASAEPVNATASLPLERFLSWLDAGAPVPTLERVTQYDLGAQDGARYSFTDACCLADGRVVFLACAEASPDTLRDGDVLGARVGVLDADVVRVTDIANGAGERLVLKLEGIDARPEPGLFDVVVDSDQEHQPAELGVLELQGL